jgi:hypothetical protein
MEGVKCLVNYRREIFETRHQAAAMDIVELVRIDPFIFGIVNFKAAVRGDTASD